MLRLRYLGLTINTDKGTFGAELEFGDGLNVIRAENWAGKTQLLQSAIYALGLEGMFTPSHALPVAHALTEYLDHADERATVIDSMVSLEIENGEGNFLTVQRSIAGERNRHLITAYEGRAITRKDARETATDYFVREPRATTSSRGFHRRLRSCPN